jgi:hypothetical protein
MLVLMVLTVISLAGADPRGVAGGKDKEIIPQARPVVIWLKGVKAGDLDQLRAAYAEKWRKQLDDKDLKRYQAFLNALVGEYNVEDFTFEFTGGDDAGKVTPTHKGKKVPTLRVIKEKGEWKLNTR